MTANYCCPQCDSELTNAGAANVFRCTGECEKIVVEAVDETKQHVREFYRRATDQWEGMLG